MDPAQFDNRSKKGSYRLEKYYRGASKDVHKIAVTGDELWIYAYESETKQQPTMWANEDKPYPTKNVISFRQILGYSMSQIMILSTFALLLLTFINDI